MKKLNLIVLIFLLSFQLVFSQTKALKGDTIYWFKRNIELQKAFELKDFEKSNDDFNFRFWNQGQVVEISKDSSVINGTITNYIYHTKNGNSYKRERLSNKIILSEEQATNIYKVIQNSKILNLPSDNNIENWKQGFDGVEYIIEHSDKESYWFKTYWTPMAQDSIPEALVVQNLVKKLSDTVNLEKVYSSFKDTLPKKGCYNSGGISNMCYIPNSLEVGYSSSSKLPFGFYSAYSPTYIGNTKINGSLAFQYNFDNKGFQHLNFQAVKWYLFYKNSPVTDYLAYNYQNRKLDIENKNNEFQNHQIKYGLNLKKNFGIGVGFDYLAGNNEKLGGHLYMNKWFSKPNISTVFSTSIFNNNINYKAQIFKSFKGIKKLAINRISLGLAYEDFMDYKDVYFNINLLF